ncbi:unnamed protein product [Protopolystoma xenopodis]|uniref:Uncharacterized protein n=1 Tax=Protopolystoma xenopodis TaxID=117903 RepID=A0A3S4ZYJ7_9PLAT|nr:unnamed protein product [Protopolystoma xenopodis]
MLTSPRRAHKSSHPLQAAFDAPPLFSHFPTFTSLIYSASAQLFSNFLFSPNVGLFFSLFPPASPTLPSSPHPRATHARHRALSLSRSLSLSHLRAPSDCQLTGNFLLFPLHCSPILAQSADTRVMITVSSAANT